MYILSASWKAARQSETILTVVSPVSGGQCMRCVSVRVTALNLNDCSFKIYLCIDL